MCTRKLVVYRYVPTQNTGERNACSRHESIQVKQGYSSTIGPASSSRRFTTVERAPLRTEQENGWSP